MCCCVHLKSSPRFMIGWAGPLWMSRCCAVLFAWIFLYDFLCEFSCELLMRISFGCGFFLCVFGSDADFFAGFSARRLQGEQQKWSKKSPPNPLKFILPISLPGYLPVCPPLDSQNCGHLDAFLFVATFGSDERRSSRIALKILMLRKIQSRPNPTRTAAS